MKIIARQSGGENFHELILPDELIKGFLLKMGGFLKLSDDMSAEQKQKIRSIRMMVKSSLLLAGDAIRSGLGIEGKPGKNDDPVDWYTEAIANKIFQDIEKQTLIFELEERDEATFITSICAKSI